MWLFVYDHLLCVREVITLIVVRMPQASWGVVTGTETGNIQQYMKKEQMHLISVREYSIEVKK